MHMTKILKHSPHLDIYWHYSAVVNTTEQPRSTMLELRFCESSNCSSTVELIIIIIIIIIISIMINLPICLVN